MSVDTPPEPRLLVWTHGLVVGMSLAQAQGIFESARTDLEPNVGRLAATVIAAACYLAWLALVVLLISWFFRRRWVRAWFAAAERRHNRSAPPPVPTEGIRGPDEGTAPSGHTP